MTDGFGGVVFCVEYVVVVEDGTEAGAIGAAAGATAIGVGATVAIGVVTGDGVTVAAGVAAGVVWAIGCGLSFLFNNNMMPTPANVTKEIGRAHV